MKKNRTMKVAALLLALTLMTSCFVGGTFAKYATSVNSTDTARVALWAFTVGEDDIRTFEFDLFDYLDQNVDVNGKRDNEKVIAPGTEGEFVLDLTNNSEVNATYSLAFDITNANNIPIEFSLDKTEWVAWDEVDFDDADAIAMGETVPVTVYWRWVIGGDTVTDTTLGYDGNATVSVKVTVEVEQVN